MSFNSIPVRRTAQQRSRKGAVTVEFAISASLFFMVTFAAIEFGRYFFVQHAVQMAAYESARAGIVPGADAEDVENRISSLLTAAGVPHASWEVPPTEITTQTREVTVRITCDFDENSWIPATWLAARDISAEITLQHENNAYLDPESEDLENLIGNNDNEPIDE